MVDQVEAKKVSKTLLKTAEKYRSKMQGGERVLRDATGKLQWASGKPVGRKTIHFMLGEGMIRELDTDLFGDFSRGQTLGLSA